MKWIAELLGIGSKIVEARSRLKVAKIEAQTTATQSRAQQDGAWEAMAAENARNSWLDEYWTAVLTVPLVLAFLGAGDAVADGFAALQGVPDWYKWSVLASVSFAFARKTMPGVADWVSRKKS
ncbi:hypothetical protein [Pseudophaeobacter flagellatus]|uniref:hypothetical protein n=1 Tax=Pseudophaeobacter flagellatus TaxID=2899119 RepID=UPI001E2D69ED|nr:hypothetical protein [Pseudophaeobacter flagellatus]MCD9147873.1 hypothetical protein [Pseudophaeobacter flagellatus]